MKTIYAALVAVALGLLLVGCGGGKGGGGGSGDAFVRFVHVSPGTDNVTITAGGAAVASSLAYHAATTYAQVGSGTPEVKVQSASGGGTYVDAQISIGSGNHYTYFLYGGGSSTTTLTLQDDVGDAASGMFNLRRVDLATGIGPLDIYLLQPGATVGASAPTFAAVAYGSSNAFAQFASGTYDVVLTPAGSKEVIYDSGKQAFAGNSKVTLLIFATGSGKLASAALLLNDSSGTTTFFDGTVARFKFLSAATDLQALDVLVDGAVALANVPYGSLSAYNGTTAGSRNFTIQPSSNQGAYVYNQNQTLASGSDYSLVAYSIPGTGSAGVITLLDDNLPPVAGKAKLRVVNAGSDTTSYDTYVNFSKLLSGIAQGTASAYQQLDAATYALTFSPTGTTTQVATLSAVLNAGHVYTVYTYGRSGSVAAVVTVDY